MTERAFSFIPINQRQGKPRSRGLIRGPYYAAVGSSYLRDVLGTMGVYVDGFKYAGGAFALMPPEQVISKR